MTHLFGDGEAIETWGENEGVPLGFTWQGTAHPVIEICNRWRVHTRWWEPARLVWREYWKVTTQDGLLCLIYHDLAGGGWFFSRLYD